MKFDSKKFVKERNEALSDFVMTGNTKKLLAYCRKYEVPIPKDKAVMAAGIYKAVQECTDISDEVKDTAFRKCIEMGFYPFMR